MNYAQRRSVMSYGQPPRQGYGTRRMEMPAPDQRVLPDRRQYGDRRFPADPRRGEWQPDDGQPPVGGPVPPGPPRRRRRRIGRILLIILLAFVLLIGGIWLYLELNLNKVEALGDYSGRPAAGSGTNWLIVGSDSRAGLSA